MHLHIVSAVLLLTTSTVLANPISPLSNSISPRYDIGPGGVGIFTGHMAGSPETDCGWHKHCIPRCTKKVDCKYECERGSGFCEGACYGDPNVRAPSFLPIPLILPSSLFFFSKFVSMLG
jgi:hypothetical protein